MSKVYELSLEVIAPLIFGLFMCLFGVLLIEIHRGVLPYAPDSMYGLFMVLIAFQTVALGRTPFGDFRRSRALVAVGIGTAVIGMVACFIPNLLTGTIRTMVGLLLTGGGTVLLLQFSLRADQGRLWLKRPGPLRHLAIAAGLVYLLSLIAGLITLFPGMTMDLQAAVLLIVYGLGFIYLAWALQAVGERFGTTSPAYSGPSATVPTGRKRGGEIRLPLNVAILLLQAVLLTSLGILLFPVSFGLLPFSPDGQLGLLLVIMAIQILTLGVTPLGEFGRSGPMFVLGMVFAGFGIISCVVPEILTEKSTILLGLLNLIGGVLGLLRGLVSALCRVDETSASSDASHGILRRLALMTTTLNVVQVVFGLSMLRPTLLPPMVGPSMVVINGLLLFVMTAILLQLDRFMPAGSSKTE